MSLKLVKKIEQPSRKIINFSQVREDAARERRKELGRILFSEFHGIKALVEPEVGGELQNLIIQDISHDGLSFLMSTIFRIRYEEGSQLKLRLYFAQGAYINLAVTIKNSNKTMHQGNEYLRYGAQIDPKSQSKKVIEALFDFMQKYADLSVQESNLFSHYA